MKVGGKKKGEFFVRFSIFGFGAKGVVKKERCLEKCPFLSPIDPYNPRTRPHLPPHSYFSSFPS